MSDLSRSDSRHDWDAYPLRDDSTRYARDWVVNQHHPSADDANPGTDAAPLKTISAAAGRAGPGERVRVHAGTYRETVRPRLGGTGPDAMIHYAAQPGEPVTISGSVVVDTPWERPRYWMDGYRDSPLTASWSRRVWIATLPESCFEDGYQPFALKNIEEAEYALMPWTEPVVNTPPFTLRRGLLFQDGRRLVQLHHEGDVRRVEGSFWVDADHRSLHLHPFGGENPNRSLIEAAVREHLFCPQSVGLDHLRISGFTFQHCANGFLRAGSGAVTTRGGQAWIIENNTIREANSSGLEFGFMPFEQEDPRMRDVPARRPHFGGTVVRNNHIHDCGTAGIRSLEVKEARVIGNTIHHCGWQEGEFYWECSGIKLLVTERTLVSGNQIHDITAGTGIWMDWDNRYSRVTRNLIHDINSQQGGIFIEASRTPGMVDRNVIWNVDGNGIYGGECENQFFLHNLVGRVSDAPVLLKKHTDRSLHGSPLANENNTVSGNCFFDTKEPVIESGTHVFRSNIHLSSRGCLLMDPAEWRRRGIEQSPFFAEADLSFDPGTRCLSRLLPGKGPFPPPAPEIRSDFFNHPWPPGAATAGPFIARTGKSRIHL